MGKLLQGILGGVSGKVGNIIGSSWKGIPIVKAKALSVANPRTAGQIAQRAKMTNVVAFSKPLLSQVIKPLWDRFAQQQSGFNAFLSENIDLFDDVMPSPASSLKIATGKMAPTAVTAQTLFSGSNSLDVSWSDDTGQGLKLTNDEVYAVVYNETQNRTAVNAAVATRSDTTVAVSFDENVSAGDVLNAYVAFRRSDGTVVSDTSFSTVTVEA